MVDDALRPQVKVFGLLRPNEHIVVLLPADLKLAGSMTLPRGHPRVRVMALPMWMSAWRPEWIRLLIERRPLSSLRLERFWDNRRGLLWRKMWTAIMVDRASIDVNRCWSLKSTVLLSRLSCEDFSAREDWGLWRRSRLIRVGSGTSSLALGSVLRPWIIGFILRHFPRSWR